MSLMGDSRTFDVVVVGAGPAGSVCAYCIARRGVSVALVDRMRFPRDKACGDLLSPRVAELLGDLGIHVSGCVRVGDMRLVGPSGRSMALPWPAGGSLPGHAEALPRTLFDEQLRLAAIEAGAEFVQGDVDRVEVDSGSPTKVVLGDGRVISAQHVVGADGSLSRVAPSAGLTAGEGLWGFALRYYVAAGQVREPLIIYWEPSPGRAFPGYGWLFPSSDGRANLGLGMSVGAHRGGADVVASLFPTFVDHLRKADILREDVELSDQERRGGWLKMGLTGTVPARGPVLLVGDAAGLVNPLSGEGISAAIRSAKGAAGAIVDTPARAASEYRASLLRRHGDFYPATAALQSFMAHHPRWFSLTGRLLTAPGINALLGPSWSMYWNDLVEGSAAGGRQTTARAIGSFAGAVTAASKLRRETTARIQSS
jgi:geranylgeranyl reductase family protein